MVGVLVAVDRRDRLAEAGPDAVVVDARRHHQHQHVVAVERPGRHDLDLHRLLRRPVALLADRPGVHLRRHVAERRNLADLVEVFHRRGGLALSVSPEAAAAMRSIKSPEIGSSRTTERSLAQARLSPGVLRRTMAAPSARNQRHCRPTPWSFRREGVHLIQRFCVQKARRCGSAAAGGNDMEAMQPVWLFLNNLEGFDFAAFWIAAFTMTTMCRLLPRLHHAAAGVRALLQRALRVRGSLGRPLRALQLPARLPGAFSRPVS